MKIIVLGGPGAGKGTQLARICKRMKIVHISTGDIFRKNISENTQLGELANTYISKGNLVPDRVTCDMVIDRLKEDDCKDGYAFDGFPRTLQQAEFIEEYLNKREEAIDIVIDIEVDDNIIIDRLGGRRTCLKCGASYHIRYNLPKVNDACDSCGNELVHRKDDEPETIRSRIEVYHKQTEPLIEYYQKQGKLIAIDGNASADEVENRILVALGRDC